MSDSAPSFAAAPSEVDGAAPVTPDQATTFASLEYGRHALPVPTLDGYGNCTVCGEHPLVHIRHGDVVDPREFHREDAAAAPDVRALCDPPSAEETFDLASLGLGPASAGEAGE